MFKLVGLLLILTALAVSAWWLRGERASKGWVGSWCLVAVFSGVFLILQDRATEITIKGVGTIKAAAEKAIADAAAISDLRNRVESQSATVDLVAKEATSAHKLAEQVADQVKTSQQRLKSVDSALAAARDKVADLDNITQFTRTVLAAQNDNRRAFDQLEAWASDPAFPMREEASSSYRTILDEHSQPMYASGFTVPWADGVDPSTFGMEKLRQQYGGAPVWLKPALIEYVWKREDLPKKKRMQFLADVIAGDPSLRAVEYAGRYLTSALGSKLKPLAVGPILEAWKKQKDEIE